MINQIPRDENSDQKKVQVYSRMKLMGEEIFTSASYKREKKRNSYTVCFSTEDNSQKYGEIQYFIMISYQGDEVIYAVLNTLTANKEFFVHTGTNIPIDHIASVNEYQKNVVVKVENILFKVINLWGKFICLRPNTYEKNL